MTDPEFLKFLGQSGAYGVLAIIVWKIGLRMISAVDKLVERIDVHTKADTEAWGRAETRIQTDFGRVAEALMLLKGHVSETMASLRSHVSEEMSVVKRDLAVLGTRVDTVLDWGGATPAPIDEEHSASRRRPLIRPDTERPIPVMDRPRRKGE